MSKTYSQNSKILRVTGTLWSGGKCEHDYTVTAPFNTTGDFSQIDSAFLISTERVISEKTVKTRLI